MDGIFYILIGILVVSILLELAYEGLNRMHIMPFEPIQKKVRYIKKKPIWKSICMFVVLIIGFGISSALKLSIVQTSLVVGILYSLNNIIFEGTFFDRLRNTLR